VSLPTFCCIAATLFTTFSFVDLRFCFLRLLQVRTWHTAHTVITEAQEERMVPKNEGQGRSMNSIKDGELRAKKMDKKKKKRKTPKTTFETKKRQSVIRLFFPSHCL